MKQSWDRIQAILLMDYYYTVRNLETIVDIAVFPAINLFVFGFLSLFLASTSAGSTVGSYVIAGAILWEVFRISQYTVSFAIMWNIWSRNLTNIMLSPITTTELLLGNALASFIKAFGLVIILGLLSIPFFGFNIFSMGILNLIGIVVNLALFGVTLGIFLMGFIFRYGTRMQAVSWGVLFLFQPISATLFPLSYLPEPMQRVAVFLPTTQMFEMGRAALADHKLHAPEIAIAFMLNLIWGFIFIGGFHLFYRNARRTGQFARNEG